MATDLEGEREGSREEEQEEDLWASILNDVAASSARTRPQVTKTLLVLGDVSSGKSTLVDRLCQISKSHPIGGKFPLSGCSLEYRFIDVQDEETDGHAILYTATKKHSSSEYSPEYCWYCSS